MGGLGFFAKIGKPWWLAGLVLVLIGGAVGGVSELRGSAGPSPQEAVLPPGQEFMTVQRQTLTVEVPLEGRLVFPQTADLTFDTSGEVGEVTVSPGQRVQQGQLLARLDPTTLAALETAVAQATLNLDKAQDKLEEVSERFATTPVEKAQFEEAIAKTRVDLSKAQDELDDFLTNHRLALAEAQWGYDDASVALDQATDALDDFLRDHGQELAQAQWSQADAQVALDQAQDALADFNVDYEKELSTARKSKADAETALEKAQDAVTDLVGTLGTSRVTDTDVWDHLPRLQAAAEAAKATLNKANEDLSRLETGPDRLKLRRLEAEMTVAKEDLAKAQRGVTRVGTDPNILKVQRLQSEVTVAQRALVKAQAELDREKRGPDEAELAAAQKKVETLQKQLDKQLDGPESLEVALQEAEVAHAQSVLADAEEDLAGGSIRAPFAGIVALVNAESDDLVTKHSPILTVVDPGRVRIDGLVGGGELRLVQPGAEAKVTVASLPGTVLASVVSEVASEPRTERGVITYAVAIQVTVPEGVEVPVAPSPVEVVVLTQVKEALVVPRRAVHRSASKTAVSVLNGHGAVEERQVVLGDRNGEWVVVRQGLSEGDRLVLPGGLAPSAG